MRESFLLTNTDIFLVAIPTLQSDETIQSITTSLDIPITITTQQTTINNQQIPPRQSFMFRVAEDDFISLDVNDIDFEITTDLRKIKYNARFIFTEII